jgi:Protein of unknown function (DUF2949)
MENKYTSNGQMLDFLRSQLALPESSIAMAVRLCHENLGTLPMILWQYGLVSLEQLEQIFDWSANSS